MKYKLSKVKNNEYLQVWDDKRTTCINLGTAQKLVNTILDVDQTNKLREKLTNNQRLIGVNND